MQALGLIETRGLLPAIECADVMLKTAKVELVGRTFVGGGLVAISVTGEVGAVKVAVEAGAQAVERVSCFSLVSQHVIARPHEDIASLFAVSTEEMPIPNPETETVELDAIIAECPQMARAAVTLVLKDEIDVLVQRFGLNKGLEALNALPVIALRKLAREYKELDLVGRAISKANKELLIQKLTEYYERGTEEK